MSGRVAIVVFLVAMVYALVSSYWLLIRGKGADPLTVRRLIWRTGLALLLFVLLYAALLLGWLHPGTGVTFPHQGMD